MVAARLNLESSELSVFANGWTIFFEAYLVTISAESVFPSASLKMNRDLADSTIWPWAAVAAKRAKGTISKKRGVRGVVLGIRSAINRAELLPSQPIFDDFFNFFSTPNSTGFLPRTTRRSVNDCDSPAIH